MKIAVIGGDGTGPEVAAEGVKVLKAVAKHDGFKFELTNSTGAASATSRPAKPARRRARPTPQVRRHAPRRRRPSRREARHPRAQAAA